MISKCLCKYAPHEDCLLEGLTLVSGSFLTAVLALLI